jgi:hypothetical protein
LVTLDLSPEQIVHARHLAGASHDQFQFAKARGHYPNARRTHIIGKLGEIGAHAYLCDEGFRCDATYADASRVSQCDIIVNDVLRVEIKTWSACHWHDLGRCIAVKQLEDVKRKCDIVLWCVVSANDLDPEQGAPGDSCSVRLAGWSEVGDIADAPVRKTGYGNMRKVMNYQLDESDLRDIPSLHERLSEG